MNGTGALRSLPRANGCDFIRQVRDLVDGLHLMKRASLRHFLLVLGALGVAGMIIWPGCATPPLPAKRTPLSNLRVTDFKYPRGSQRTRTELEAQLGKPDEFFEDLNVACYRLNKVSRRRLCLLLGVIPIAAPRDPDVIELGMVQFDAQQRVSRAGVKTERIISDPGTSFPEGQAPWDRRPRFRGLVERWLADPKSAPKANKC